MTTRTSDKATEILKDGRGWTVDLIARSDAANAAREQALEAGASTEVADAWAEYVGAYAGLTKPEKSKVPGAQP